MWPGRNRALRPRGAQIVVSIGGTAYRVTRCLVEIPVDQWRGNKLEAARILGIPPCTMYHALLRSGALKRVCHGGSATAILAESDGLLSGGMFAKPLSLNHLFDRINSGIKNANRPFIDDGCPREMHSSD